MATEIIKQKELFDIKVRASLSHSYTVRIEQNGQFVLVEKKQIPALIEALTKLKGE